MDASAACLSAPIEVQATEMDRHTDRGHAPMTIIEGDASRIVAAAAEVDTAGSLALHSSDGSSLGAVPRQHHKSGCASGRKRRSQENNEEYVIDQCIDNSIQLLPDDVPYPKAVCQGGAVIGWRCRFGSGPQLQCSAGGQLFPKQMFDPDRPDAALRAAVDHTRNFHASPAPTANKRARLSEGGPRASMEHCCGSEDGDGDDVETAMATLQRAIRDGAKLAAENARLTKLVSILEARAHEADTKMARSEERTVEADAKLARALEIEAQAEKRASAADAKLSRLLGAFYDVSRGEVP